MSFDEPRARCRVRNILAYLICGRAGQRAEQANELTKRAEEVMGQLNSDVRLLHDLPELLERIGRSALPRTPRSSPAGVGTAAPIPVPDSPVSPALAGM